MESEGPYKSERWECQNEFVITGPGWEFVGGTYTKNEADLASRFANLAYAEGRKSAKKDLHYDELSLKYLVDRHESLVDDFKELLEVAEDLYVGCEHHLARCSFVDWKKARGIE